MENKGKPTLVDGVPNGNTTESGNVNHSGKTGKFEKKDGNSLDKELEFEELSDDYDLSQTKKEDFLNGDLELDEEEIDWDNLEFEELSDEDILDIINSEEKEISEDVLSKIDGSEAFAELFNTPNIDKEKIYGIDEEKAKAILKAQKLLEQKSKDNTLVEFDKKEFVGLWYYPVTPSDYELKKQKGNYDKKMFYYLNDYLGSNKEEKIALLEEFEKYGKLYSEKKAELEAQYKEAQALVNEYFKEDPVYSQENKDKAIWCHSMEESKKEFDLVSDKVISELNKEDKKYINSVILYTGSYSSINSPLRSQEYPHKKQYPGQSMQKKGEFVDVVENITYAIDKSSYDKNVWVQRGVSNIVDDMAGVNIDLDITDEELSNLVGITYKDHGFLSCGAAKNTGFGSKPVIMNIYCPAGTKMLYVPSISKYKSENEMIIQRGYSFKIQKAYRKNGKIYLDLDVQLGSDEDKYQTDQLIELSHKWL